MLILKEFRIWSFQHHFLIFYGGNCRITFETCSKMIHQFVYEYNSKKSIISTVFSQLKRDIQLILHLFYFFIIYIIDASHFLSSISFFFYFFLSLFLFHSFFSLSLFFDLLDSLYWFLSVTSHHQPGPTSHQDLPLIRTYLSSGREPRGGNQHTKISSRRSLEPPSALS